MRHGGVESTTFGGVRFGRGRDMLLVDSSGVHLGKPK